MSGYRSEYRRVHDDLKRIRGSAVGRPCAAPDCDRLADGWGLVGEGLVFGMKNNDGLPDDVLVRWSRDPRDYAPLCYSHNAQMDHGGDWLYCPRGHYRLTFGKDSKGECIGCRRVRLRDIKRRHRVDPAYRARERGQRQARRTAARMEGTEQ
ncbi:MULTISPECIES: hypothetical protein [unclassified Microbacterium]|uniref:hypothetical protein n=1 Tax=unclassified Microbacterium TaxID=2609290 RepID=UPI003864B73C